MARNLAPITKLSRREGTPLHPKAMRIMIKRTSSPGRGRDTRAPKASQYALQLREKQKVKRIYGLLEKQFKKLFKEAAKTKGQTGEELLRLLERRLDNVVFRAGFAPSRRAARQLTSHGHFKFNGRRVDIPSIRVSVGDVIELRDKSLNNQYFSNITQVMASAGEQSVSWLKVDKSKFTINVTSLPLKEEGEPDINEQLIVEFYSR